jgi:hypothetical protein
LGEPSARVMTAIPYSDWAAFFLKSTAGFAIRPDRRIMGGLVEAPVGSGSVFS